MFCDQTSYRDILDTAFPRPLILIPSPSRSKESISLVLGDIYTTVHDDLLIRGIITSTGNLQRQACPGHTLSLRARARVRIATHRPNDGYHQKPKQTVPPSTRSLTQIKSRTQRGSWRNGRFALSQGLRTVICCGYSVLRTNFLFLKRSKLAKLFPG